MKKFFVSIGLAAAGTASLQAAYAPGLNSMETTKLWSLSATLRGFYDSNDNTSSDPQSGYGFEVSPQFELNVPLQQTELGLRYTYGLYYYQEREQLHENPIDQTHQLDLWVDHAFSERAQGTILDSFIIGQEPQLLSNNGIKSDLQRVEGNNIANYATFTLHNDWTRLLSTDLEYDNGFHYYQNNGTTINDLVLGESPSLAGTLNRVENTVSLNFNWQVRPETVAFVGVQYGQVNYIANEPIALVDVYPYIYYSKVLDNRSYTGYVGTQYNFLPNLAFTGKVGLTYTEDYNDPLNTTSLSPYAVASLTYTYAPGDYAQLGINHARNATDQVDPVVSTGSIVHDQESTLIFGNINHYLTPKLLATAIGQVQISTYNGGSVNNDTDTDYGLGLSLNYNFTPHFSANAGYNYDYVQSQIAGLGYNRNRIYLGVSAAY